MVNEFKTGGEKQLQNYSDVSLEDKSVTTDDRDDDEGDSDHKATSAGDEEAERDDGRAQGISNDDEDDRRDIPDARSAGVAE